MGNVIGLSNFIPTFQCRTTAPPAGCGELCDFTRRDRADLERWARSGRAVQYSVYEMTDFAMLYEPGRAWASWGVVREGRSVRLWNCVSLADVGRFPTMIDALAEIASDDEDGSDENVICFMASQVRLVGLTCPA